MFEHFAIAAAFNGVVTYAQTGNVSSGLRTAAITMLNEYAWAATGDALDIDKAGWQERSLVHGAVGGSMAQAEGGNFKNGFLSAAVSQALSGEISQIKITNSDWATVASRGLAAGVVGGTVAAATGDNFENGMMTSAAAEIFNDNGPEKKLAEDLEDGITDIAEGGLVDAGAGLLAVAQPETLPVDAELEEGGTAKIVKGVAELMGDEVPARSGADLPMDGTQKPAEGFEWRGNGNIGSGKGSWYHPNTGESLYPDLEHPDPIGPHWDYKDPNGTWWRLFPDGNYEGK